MRVIPLTAAREDDWTAFLRARPEALLYHSLPYRDLLADLLGCRPDYLVAVDADERVRGALPIMWALDASGTRVANALPYYGSNGAPVADSDEAAAALAAAWDARATAPDTAAATLVANPLAGEPKVAHTHVDERISMVTDLPDPGGDFEERLLAAIDASARRNVRKAERAGYEVVRDEEALDDLRRLHEENMAAIGGAAKSAAFFEAVPRHFRAGDEWQLWVARDGRSVAAALLVFHFGATAEYYTPAIAHEHRSSQPLSAILVAAMADAALRGLRRWNWGGTWRSQTGVYRFKRKWGAVERSYRYLTQLNDATLLERRPEDLTARFPNFFVVPFGALHAAAASA